MPGPVLGSPCSERSWTLGGLGLQTIPTQKINVFQSTLFISFFLQRHCITSNPQIPGAHNNGHLFYHHRSADWLCLAVQVAGWGQVWSTFLHSGTQVEQAAASQAARNLPWLLKSSAQTSTLSPLSTFYWPKQITWPSPTSKGQESRPLPWNVAGESEYFLKNNLPNRENIKLATT